jgi:hypothetical protein
LYRAAAGMIVGFRCIAACVIWVHSELVANPFIKETCSDPIELSVSAQVGCLTAGWKRENVDVIWGFLCQFIVSTPLFLVVGAYLPHAQSLRNVSHLTIASC